MTHTRNALSKKCARFTLKLLNVNQLVRNGGVNKRLEERQQLAA